MVTNSNFTAGDLTACRETRPKTTRSVCRKEILQRTSELTLWWQINKDAPQEICKHHLNTEIWEMQRNTIVCGAVKCATIGSLLLVSFTKRLSLCLSVTCRSEVVVRKGTGACLSSTIHKRGTLNWPWRCFSGVYFAKSFCFACIFEHNANRDELKDEVRISPIKRIS